MRLALTTLALMAAAACRKSEVLTEAKADLLTTANFGLLGVEFFESSNNSKRWNIRSDFAEIHRSENSIYLKQVKADFYAERTKNVIHSVSDHGRSALDKNEVILMGNVFIRSRTGYEFKMNTLKYDGDRHEFRSPDEVNMRGPNRERPMMLLNGIGLLADIDQEHFFLRRRVIARKRFRGDSWLVIKSSEGEFFTEEQHAVFTGKVEAKVPPELSVESDTLELVSASSREIMEARGGVRLKLKEKLGWAELAFFEAGGDNIILEGNARIESKGDELKGRRIVLYTVDDRVEVTGAQGRVRN